MCHSKESAKLVCNNSYCHNSFWSGWQQRNIIQNSCIKQKISVHAIPTSSFRTDGSSITAYSRVYIHTYNHTRVNTHTHTHTHTSIPINTAITPQHTFLVSILILSAKVWHTVSSCLYTTSFNHTVVCISLSPPADPLYFTRLTAMSGRHKSGYSCIIPQSSWFFVYLRFRFSNS
jgi:hypothetical protein